MEAVKHGGSPGGRQGLVCGGGGGGCDAAVEGEDSSGGYGVFDWPCGLSESSGE